MKEEKTHNKRHASPYSSYLSGFLGFLIHGIWGFLIGSALIPFSVVLAIGSIVVFTPYSSYLMARSTYRYRSKDGNCQVPRAVLWAGAIGLLNFIYTLLLSIVFSTMALIVLPLLAVALMLAAPVMGAILGVKQGMSGALAPLDSYIRAIANNRLSLEINKTIEEHLKKLKNHPDQELVKEIKKIYDEKRSNAPAQALEAVVAMKPFPDFQVWWLLMALSVGGVSAGLTIGLSLTHVFYLSSFLTYWIPSLVTLNPIALMLLSAAIPLLLLPPTVSLVGVLAEGGLRYLQLVFREGKFKVSNKYEHSEEEDEPKKGRKVYRAPKPLPTQQERLRSRILRFCVPLVFMVDILKWFGRYTLGYVVGPFLSLSHLADALSFRENIDENKLTFFDSELQWLWVDTHDGERLSTLEVRFVGEESQRESDDETYYIYFNANAQILNETSILYLDCIARVWNVVSVGFEYRGSGKSTGHGTAQGLLVDGIAQVQRLLDKGVDSNKIILHGHSLGGGIATQVAYYFSKKGIELVLINDRSFTNLGDVAIGWLASKGLIGWLASYGLMPLIKFVMEMSGQEIEAATPFNALPQGKKQCLYVDDDAILSNYGSLYRRLTPDVEGVRLRGIETHLEGTQRHQTPLVFPYGDDGNYLSNLGPVTRFVSAL